ncbi:MAG: hypothetical protein WDO73_16040 [Ignavibacteriota bacterium]
MAANIPHEMLLLDLYAALRPIDAITGATHGGRHPESHLFYVLYWEVKGSGWLP